MAFQSRVSAGVHFALEHFKRKGCISPMVRCRRMACAAALLALAACAPASTLPPAAAVAPTPPPQPAAPTATATPLASPTPVHTPTVTSSAPRTTPPAPSETPTVGALPTMTPTTVPPATSTPAPPALPAVTGEQALVIVRVHTDTPYVTITVDDFFSASNYQDREAIQLLEAANDLGAALTLCPTGYALEAYNTVAPEQLVEIKRLIAAGSYELCNHSLSHPRMSELDGVQQQQEISVGRTLVEQHLEQPVGPFFRPPFGVWNDDTRRAALASGYPYIVNWSVDSGDWEGTEPPSIERLLANLSCVQPGDILLMHANRQRSAELLPVLVAQLRAKGLEPVTLRTLLTSGEPVIMHHPTDLEQVRYCAS